MSEISVFDTIDHIEQLIKYARKGTDYDRISELLNDERKNHKEEMNKLRQNNNKIIHRMFNEIIELKSTHPDYVKVTCHCCNGEGGFDCPDGGDVCGNCGGDGVEYIKKELNK